MKKWVINIFRACAGFTILMVGMGWCEEELPEVRQITTHPSKDFYPALSPDGDRLAFTSERSGNLDIWVKSFSSEQIVQVTFHQAEDSRPAWSPDGKTLIFNSKRRDATGDVWLVSLDMKGGGRPKGKPVQITNYLGPDKKPSFSPDGKNIVYASDRDGTTNLWLVNIDSKEHTQLTRKGGTDPSWSPMGEWILFTSFRFDAGGDLFMISAGDQETDEEKESSAYPVTEGESIDGQGAWAPNGNEIVFLRYDRDTDGDGRITPDDNGSVWIKRLGETGLISVNEVFPQRGEIQITTEVYGDKDPCWGSNEEILFTSMRGGSMEVWSIPEWGIITRAASAVVQYNMVLERFGESVTREALFQSILGFKRIRDYFHDDSLLVSKALIRIGEQFQLLGEERAESYYLEARSSYAVRDREKALAELKMATISLSPLEERIRRCKLIIDLFPEERSVVVEAWVILGDIYREQGKTAQSLAAYAKVSHSFPEMRNWKAMAQLRIGDLFRVQGQEETARQSYMLILREYGDVPLWRKRAVLRMLNQIQGSAQEKIRGFQQIVQQAGDFPSLVAEAQLSIARTLVEMGQKEQAIRELDQVEKIVPTSLWAQAEARIMQARLYGDIGDELKGILLLENAINSYGDLEGGRYTPEARNELFSLLFNSAERLKASGDFALAEARYRKAVQLRPDNILVHRGLIEAAYYRGRIEKLIVEYEEKLEGQPRNPVLIYAFGFALSYYGEGSTEQLNQSNEYLSRALTEDYRMVYPYLTMSYNYELLERLEEERQKKKPGFFIRAGRIVIAPIKWAYGLLPFGGDSKKERYYEKAINALITAVELNDETIDLNMEVLLVQNLANNFYHLGEFGYKKAYFNYQRRLSLDSTFTRVLEKAVFFERSGHCGTVLADEENAGRHLRIAIQTYEDLGREQDVFRNKRMLAFHFHLSGQYEDAIQIYEEIILQDEKTGLWDEVERGYRNIAYNYYLMGEPEDALKFARSAEKILNRQEIPVSPPKKSSLRIELLGFSIPVWGMEEIGGASAEGFTIAEEAALVYSLISRSLESIKSYPHAVAYEQKRLEIFNKRKDRLAKRITLNRIGRLYYKMADYDKAWDYFYRCWEESKKEEDEKGRWVSAVNMGNCASVELSFLEGEAMTDKTLFCLEEELERVSTKEREVGRERVVLLNTMGTLLTLRIKKLMAGVECPDSLSVRAVGHFKDLNMARNYFLQGLKTSREKNYWRDEGIILKNLAEVFDLSGDDSTAYHYLDRSYQVLQKRGEEELLWRLLYGMAGLAREISSSQGGPEKGLENALSLYRRAMDLLESIPLEESGTEERISDRGERWQLYVDAAFNMIQEGMHTEALETIERGREKHIADLLARRPPQWKRERHKVVWGNLRYIKSRLHQIRKEIIREERGSSRSRKFNELMEEKERNEKEYVQILGKIREEDEVLAYLTGAEPVDLSAVQSLFYPDGGALCYLVGRDSTILWTVDADSVNVNVLDVKMDDLLHMVNQFSQSISRDSLAEEIGQELYDLLLKPAASFIEDKARLVVVPDGFLWNVPFGALPNGEEVLLDMLSVTYTPSLTVYKLAWERRKINQEDGLLVGDERDRSFLGALEKTTKSEIALLGSGATEEAFGQAAQSADLVHMGRWMIYSERDPLLSSIVLFPDKNQDGFLRAEEIFSRDFRASLCFLPSHGEGMERGWQGPISFVLGLLYAGVPTVVTPIWPVDREVRDSFYYDFYSSLKDHSVSYALEEAQFSLRQKYPGLRSWGSFQLVGFEGMNPGEKIRHAEKHLITEVRKGLIYEQRKEYRDAVELFERALDLAEAVQDTTFKERLMLLIIRASRDGSMWSKAIEYQNLIKEAAERKGNRENLLWSMKNLVTFYIRDGQQKQAVQEKKEYIDFILGEGRLKEVASSYQELGFIYAMGREFANAVDQIDEAYTLYEELEDSEGQGSSLIIKGRFELEGDLYWEAIRDLKLGIKRLEEIVADSSNISKIQMGLASGNQLLGLACEKVARYDEALILQEKGLDLFEKLQLDAQVAQGIQYLANLYWKTGDYRQATFYQEKALKEFESMDDKKLLAMAYNTQGLIYLSLGSVSDARSAEHKALDLAEASGSLADQATILKNMGMICVRENDLNQAYEYFLQASSIDSSIGFRRGLAYDYRNLGTLIVRLGRSEEGISLLDNGLRLSREIGDRRNEVHAYYGLGQAYRINGDMKSALAVLDSGAVSAAGLNIPELLWRIYRLRAGVLKDTGRDSEALIDYKKAIEVVEGLRAELKVEAFKQGFLDDKMDLYVDVISHLLEMGKNEEALGFVERAKSRSFIDLLGNKRLVLSEAKGDLLEQERAARMDLQEAQDRIAAYAGATREVLTSRERDEKREWQIELEKRRKHFETVLVKIRIENPELASFVSVDPWKVDEIQNILPDSTALVEYFLTRKELFVWVVASDNIIARRIDVQADNIRELVREFRETIQANLSVDLESRELYQLLIKPIESDIQSIRHLVLVPHGVLHYLPFAALQDEEGIYLLERFSLSLAPSATVLGYCLEKGGEGFGEAAKKSVLAFSNPDLKNPLYDLPFAEKEVVSLRRTFNRVKAFFGEDAVEGRVIEEAGSHNLIHFASHATYEPESPLFSSILLSPSESNDGRLEAHEIFGLKLNCDLVTLSACETGLGKITEGDEIIGLARSFIFAGTPSIVTSLWKVDDLSTAVMVKRFYRFLRAGFSRSEALRQAQLLVREGINGHPSAWAAFTLTGDFR